MDVKQRSSVAKQDLLFLRLTWFLGGEMVFGFF